MNELKRSHQKFSPYHSETRLGFGSKGKDLEPLYNSSPLLQNGQDTLGCARHRLAPVPTEKEDFSPYTTALAVRLAPAQAKGNV